jgi:phosphatidylinositol-3-phosphatase
MKEGCHLTMRRHAGAAFGITVMVLAMLASQTVRASTLAAGAAGVTTGASSNPCGTSATPPVTYQHVIWIWMEDSTLPKVIGNSAAPYITSLAKECGYAKGWLDNVINGASNYVPGVAGANCNDETLHAIAPNGDVCITQGLSPAAKCTASSCKNTVAITSIFEQLQNVPGDSWKAYEESMPSNCFTSNTSSKTAPYYVRHNPAPYLSDLRIVGQLGGNTCATNDVAVPTTSCNGTSCTPNETSNPFYNDLTNNTLPSFSFVTPNACNNMHNKCTPYANKVTNGDQWLSTWLPIITGSPAYQSGNTAVFIMWDQGKVGSAIPNVIVAPTVVPGTVVLASTTMNNVAALGTTETMLGLGPIGCATGTQGDGSKCPLGSTTDLRSLFNI